MAIYTESPDIGNDTLTAVGVPFGDEVQGSIGYPDGPGTDFADYFAFQADGLFSFTLTGLTDDIDLALYSWNGVDLVQMAVGESGGNVDEVISGRAIVGLTYYLAVVPFNSATSTYSLFSTFTPVNTIIRDGTSNTVVATEGFDEIYVYGGADYVSARGGDDTVWGGGERDTIEGGLGNDVIYGEVGHDRLFGDAGNDNLMGGAHNDVLFGGAGYDSLSGEDGNDSLEAGNNDDVLFGGSGRDTMRGGYGNDDLDGDFDTDLLYGDSGNDRIVINHGADSAYGGDGNDTIQIYNDNPLSKAWGDAGNDSMAGDLGADWLRGGRGDDYVDGAGGNDTLFGDLGDDLLTGGAGNDSLNAGLGYDSVRGGAGTDTIDLGPADGVEDVVYFLTEWIFDEGLQTDVLVWDMAADSITGFVAGEDVIDLYFMDANDSRANDQRFVFNGSIGPRANGLWYDGTVDTTVHLDTNGDALADYSFTLVNFADPLSASDFVL